MSDVINFVVSFIITSVLGIVCSFLCILADNKEEIWNLILGKENKNE